jgi:hypothetical protein
MQICTTSPGDQGEDTRRGGRGNTVEGKAGRARSFLRWTEVISRIGGSKFGFKKYKSRTGAQCIQLSATERSVAFGTKVCCRPFSKNLINI